MTNLAQTWRVLHEALRQAFHPQNVLFALAGTLLMVAVWNLAGAVGMRGEVSDGASRVAELNVRSHHQALSSATHVIPQGVVDLWTAVRDPEARSDGIEGSLNRMPVSPVAAYVRLADPIRRLFFFGHTWSIFFYYLIGGVGSILIWAFLGLPITRRTTLRIGRETTLEFRDAVSFAWNRGYTAFSAVVIPLIGIAMMAIPVVALGLLMRWDAGVFAAGLLWILVTLVSCFMAILAIGLFLGWPLMWGAVSADDVDGFDAISRSYAYGMQRPMNYACYVLLGLSLATLGWIGAWLVAEMVISLNYWCVELGAGSTRLTEILQQTSLTKTPAGEDTATHALVQNAGFVIRSVESLVRATVSAVSFSLFFSMAGAIYLLLRRDIDEAEFDQITDH